VAVPASAQSLGDNPDILAAERVFSAWMEGQLAYRGLPGVEVAIIHDQQLIWSHGFGWADIKGKVPMTAETKFRIASNSKLFTAIAIMQLREEGKLRLDDPVTKYLPWFKLKPTADDDGEITIAQLLDHSSGMPREFGDYWDSYIFPTTKDIERDLANHQAAFPPATRWKYSNVDFAVLGMVIEKITGQSWADYVEKNIFKPLSMTDSSVDKKVPGLAVPYGRRMPDGSREVLPFVDSAGIAPAAGVTSDVKDLTKFVSAWMRRGPRGGEQVVSTGSWREMLRVRSVDQNWQSGSGLGFDVKRVNGKTYVGHGGGYPGYTTQTLMQPDNKIGLIVLTNTNDSNPADIANQLMASVGEAIIKAENAAKPAMAWDPSWERFAGLYRGRWTDEQVVVLNKKLAIMSPNQASIGEPLVLEPLGDGKFKYAAPTGGGPAGEVVRFVEEKGKPMRMYTGERWVDRVQ
jgi:CubicO group peptidase (beta-lactamase class C family)